MRNCYRPTTVKTTTDAIRLERPKVRGTLEAFSSRPVGKHVTRTNARESLVISGWVRDLSDVAVDELFFDASHFRIHDGT